MPNHVVNIVSFEGKSLQIKQMLSEIQNDEFGPGSISFQKLIPMPPELEIECGSRTEQGIKAYRDYLLQTPAASSQTSIDSYLQAHPEIDRSTFELGKRAALNSVDYGSPTWYEWHIARWGTNWDAYGYEENVDYSTTGELRFLTAWAEPQPVMEKLSVMYPLIKITHKWANGDVSMGCGKAVYQAGIQTELETFTELTQAHDFANKLWHSYDHAGVVQGTSMEQQL